MRKLLLALFFVCCCIPAFATIPHSGVWYDAPSGSGGGIAIGGAEIGTCATGDIMILDLNGVVRCPSLTTTDPADVLIRSGSCYELDATCTAPDLNIVAGLDTKQFTTIVQANCAAADNARAVVRDKTNTVLANCDCTVGTTWTCITDNNTCATGLAACLDACPGLSAQSSGATVGVRPDPTTMSVTLSMSTDAGGVCAVASNGTDGTTTIVGPFNIATVPGTNAATFAANGTTVLNGITTANSAFTFTSTIDARGNVANSTGDVVVADNQDIQGTLDITAAAAKGQLTTIERPATQTLTCLGGGSATLVTSGLIPDGAFLIGVTTRVTTALTGPTSYSVGDGTDVDMYGATLAVAQGTTSSNANATAVWTNPKIAASEVTITMNGGNCTAGVLSVNAHYFTVTAPTAN